MNKSLIKILAVVIIVGAGSFYGGMRYGQQTGSASVMQGNFQRGGIGGGRRGNGNGMGGDAASGEIISKDDKSITIKLMSAGSKIIFVSDSTQVMKSISGSVSDLTVGAQVTTFGTANADGSVTAKSIQIRTRQVANPN